MDYDEKQIWSNMLAKVNSTTQHIYTTFLLLAQSLMALRASRKFSIFGTSLKISSVTRQPFRLRTHFWSRFFSRQSSRRSCNMVTSNKLFNTQKWMSIKFWTDILNKDQQEWSMKCSSLNHFYAMNSASHLCLDKVTFINVSNYALKTEALWEMSPNCQGSLAQQHIISQETSSLQQQDCDTLKLCIHLLPIMIRSGVPRNFFFWGGVQQIQLRTERTGIWGAVAP